MGLRMSLKRKRFRFRRRPPPPPLATARGASWVDPAVPWSAIDLSEHRDRSMCQMPRRLTRPLCRHRSLLHTSDRVLRTILRRRLRSKTTRREDGPWKMIRVYSSPGLHHLGRRSLGDRPEMRSHRRTPHSGRSEKRRLLPQRVGWRNPTASDPRIKKAARPAWRCDPNMCFLDPRRPSESSPTMQWLGSNGLRQTRSDSPPCP